MKLFILLMMSFCVGCASLPKDSHCEHKIYIDKNTKKTVGEVQSGIGCEDLAQVFEIE
jgi:hypothetical protein